MGRSFSELAEVADRRHDSGSKMMMPDAIHHHSGCQWIIWIGNRFGEFQTAAAARKRRGFGLAEDLQEPSGCEVSRMILLTANCDRSIFGMRGIAICGYEWIGGR